MSFVQIDSAQELIAEAFEMSELERECFFAMRSGEYTVKELVDETGRSRSMVQRALKDLHDKGAVVREGRTDRTVYYVYRRAPLHEVRDTVEDIVDEWYREMKQLLEG
ncbi:MAG: helix-turn-helix domain-containing protein [Candidatus Nanohaloarchaea archaeon]|nr:helix-turn-helix domain-containing protein [Candidatus Nanohaloarchaea archaeon]